MVAPAPNLCYAPTPVLEFLLETFWVSDGPEGARFEPQSLPALRLTFEYGGTEIPCDDERSRFFLARPGGAQAVFRDETFEQAARRELEALGALEVACLDGAIEAAAGARSHYLLSADQEPQAYCRFYVRAFARLPAWGFRLEHAADFPYRVLATQPAWYFDVEATGGGWFECELGVVVEGQRVSLLEPLLALLDRADGTELSGLEARAERALPLGHGRYIRLPKSLIASLLEVLRALHCGPDALRGPRPRLRAHRSQLVSLDRLAGTVDEASREQGGASFEGGCLAALRAAAQRLTAAARESPLEVPAPGLCATLRSYQGVGVAWLGQLFSAGLGGVLADDMGLGKTLQTVAHLCRIHASREHPGGQSLVVVPTSLLENWRRELARFAPALRVVLWHGAERNPASLAPERAEVIVTSYALLARDKAHWLERPLLALVLDEAQAIKNPSCEARAVACRLSARQRLCLSGTPVQNHLGDLWSLFDFLMPGLLGSGTRFQRTFRQPIEVHKDSQALEALRQLVKPFILRRRKEEVASELPPKTRVLRAVVLSGQQRTLYESVRVAAHAQVRRAIRTQGLAQSKIAILDALMKLRQVCCDPRLLAAPAFAQRVPSAKYAACMELLDELLGQGRRVLVFSQFTKMLDLLEKGLAPKNVGCLKLTGETRERQALVDSFEAGYADVFLISLKAGGTGLNLTSADSVIHYDPWWNPAAEAQATDRAHRIGQCRPVLAYHLIVEGSVEERMLALQRSKRLLATTIVGDAATGASRPFDESDWDQLLGPLQSASPPPRASL